MLPDSARYSSTFCRILRVLLRVPDGFGLMVSQFLPSLDDHRAVFGIHLDHDACALGVLARDEGGAAPAKGDVDETADFRPVEDEPPQKAHGLHRRMERTPCGLRRENDRLVLAAVEFMRAVPAVQD